MRCRDGHTAPAEAVQLSTPNHPVARAWHSAVEDLCALPLGLPSGPAAPAAGLPGYQYLFARDVLTTAWQAALALPRMMPDSLQVLAASQGQVIDDWRDEEPGKFVYQARNGPLSALGKDPFLRYYDGRTRGQEQGWKDSPDAIVDEWGEVVDNPLATCELQAYWYAGLRQAALAFLLAGDRLFAARLLRKAADLRRRFDQAFWLPDQGFYALALDPDKRPIRSLSSNPGHLLATGIVPAQKAPTPVRVAAASGTRRLPPLTRLVGDPHQAAMVPRRRAQSIADL